MEVDGGSRARNPGSFCLVCGNPSEKTGVKLHTHYGALTCLGCKAFFRRSVRENRAYKCKQSEETEQKEPICLVNIGSRIKCKKCRFLKCLEVGMDMKCVLVTEVDRKKYTNHKRERDNVSLNESVSRSYILAWAEVDLETEAISEIVSLQMNPGKNPVSKETYAHLLLAHITHFERFASAFERFTQLPEPDQTLLLKKNAPLVCHYILARYVSAETGVDQLTWLLGPHTPHLGKKQGVP